MIQSYIANHSAIGTAMASHHPQRNDADRYRDDIEAFDRMLRLLQADEDLDMITLFELQEGTPEHAFWVDRFTRWPSAIRWHWRSPRRSIWGGNYPACGPTTRSTSCQPTTTPLRRWWWSGDRHRMRARATAEASANGHSAREKARRVRPISGP